MAKKKKGKWIQDASARMDAKGTKGSYGSHSVKQMEKDKGKGGAIGKKANFALNMHKIGHKKHRGKRSRG